MAVIPVIVAGVLWSRVPPISISLWLALVLALIGIRYLASAAYEKRRVSFQEAGLWCRRMLMISLSLGLLWAFAILAFFVDDSQPHQVFIITVAVTLGIGSISSGTHWLPLYYVYGVPILLALTLRLLMVGTLPFMALSLMMFLALLASVAFVRKLNSVVRSEMFLRHESANLAEQLRIKTAEAEEAVFAKSRVLAAASHDLRQPLHALSLFFDALKVPQSIEEQSRIFRRVDTSIASLRKLFDALFDMSRLDANIVRPELSHFDVCPFLEDIVEEYRKEATNRKLKLKLRAVSGIIKSDCTLLERILRNLISNALRYTNSGGILIAVRKRPCSVIIQVWDTGIGIPRESHAKAFMEFQRLHLDAGGREKGLGFGLAIVKRLCELLEHPLSLRSIVGKGSVLSLEVPAGDENASKTSFAALPEASTTSTGHRILVVDDDASILNAMETLLSTWGFRVFTARDFADSVDQRAGSDCPPDLILTDLDLRQQQNGIDVIESFRDYYGHKIPGILISGTTDREQLQKAKASGIRLIEKPLSPPLLRSIILHQLIDSDQVKE